MVNLITRKKCCRGRKYMLAFMKLWQRLSSRSFVLKNLLWTCCTVWSAWPSSWQQQLFFLCQFSVCKFEMFDLDLKPEDLFLRVVSWEVKVAFLQLIVWKLPPPVRGIFVKGNQEKRKCLKLSIWLSRLHRVADIKTLNIPADNSPSFQSKWRLLSCESHLTVQARGEVRVKTLTSKGFPVPGHTLETGAGLLLFALPYCQHRGRTGPYQVTFTSGGL